ncbi:hypothetical protein GCM10011612_18480 [Actinomyces gaoshouyii]|uniref:Uncharacterized protein n=1 Tax=Actinomyces gaoshouyii TaxID=1960083 RepID=A0A8H9HBF4_9ACTO|nr:hypothetical protein GCM10011612_18480 [Actinomyces gaoshouyii]
MDVEVDEVVRRSLLFLLAARTCHDLILGPGEGREQGPAPSPEPMAPTGREMARFEDCSPLHRPQRGTGTNSISLTCTVADSDLMPEKGILKSRHHEEASSTSPVRIRRVIVLAMSW